MRTAKTGMNKTAAIVFAAGALLALWLFWQMIKPRPVDFPVDKDELVQAPQVEAPRVVQTFEDGEQSKLALKKHWELPLSYYPQKKMAYAKSHLWILQGLTATMAKHKDMREVARINQYYVYKTSNDALENIVFDDQKRQYGVLTFEINVVVQGEILPALAQKYGLEVLKKGALGSESILRSNSGLFFARDLPYFAKETGVKTFRPHVRYGTDKFH